MKTLPSILLVFFVSLAVYPQELSLATMFTDALVLQQQCDAPIWGTGKPGSTVTVNGSWGSSASCTVGPNGEWKADLATPAAGGPYSVTVTQDSRAITLNDVLIGEVWLCSGQSNMEMPLRGWPPADTIGGWFNEIPNAIYPQIRMFTVERKVSTEPLRECTGTWKECLPSTAALFSATAYFFGKKLHNELNVPVGLILSSWGGTPVQAWTSEPFIVKDPLYANAAEQFKNNRETFTRLQQWLADRPVIDLTPFSSRSDWRTASFGDASLERAEQFDSSWKSTALPGGWEQNEIGPFDGVVWYRRTAAIPSAWKGKELSVALGPIDDYDAVFVNGTKIGGMESGSPWNIPRSYRIAASLVNDTVLTIAVRVIDTGGGGGMWGTEKQMELGLPDGSERISLAGQWKYRAVAEIRNGKAYLFDNTIGLNERPRGAVDFGPDHPASLYNGMIAPIIPYAVKGAIW
ncbi:MAG: glycosyl hydrolase family 2, partial [Ignavibacteriales bacterium]|nr:glycosyl hydrolase family 2 [Ignavibacteriales bacterium]